MSYMKSSDSTKPHIIIMMGIPRSGKSFFAEHFAETFKSPIISFDRLRKEIFTYPSFSNDEDEIIAKVANYLLDEVLKTKRTVIYEGKTNLKSDRAKIIKKAKDAGYNPLLIWVQTEVSAARRRAIQSTVEKPALTVDEFDAKVRQFKVPTQNEKVIVISGKHTYASQMKLVLKHLIQPRNVDATTIDGTIRSPISRNHLIR